MAPDGTKLVFSLDAPYFEIWAADLDPNTSIVESLGPSLTLEEHLQEELAFYTQRIEANPEDANSYHLRAQYHGYLGDRASANADMRRWSAVVSGGWPLDSSLGASREQRRVINLPFDCQLVFSAERPGHTIPMMSVAFGQKERCKMKLFRIPMFVTSLFGLGLLCGLDAPPVYADFAFGEPTNLGPIVNTSAWEGSPCISADGLSLFFMSDRVGGYGGYDIWVLTRETTGDPWGEPVNLGPLINGSNYEGEPSLSADGLSLYFWATFPPGGYGWGDILVTTRATTEDDWGPAENLGPTVNSPANDFGPAISFDGLQLFFCDHEAALRPGGFGNEDLWTTMRPTVSDPWSPPVNLGPTVNSPYRDIQPCISSDGLMLFFASPRPGGQGDRDIWVARRATADDDWGTPVNLGPMVNSPSTDSGPSISPDGRTLYFYSDRPGGYGDDDLWQAPILPVVDFNGDGKVSGRDVVIMVACWGQIEPACDIGPRPFGDGTVDEKDLFVLAPYLEPDGAVTDPTLIAHWPLDETEGMLAFDCAGENDAILGGTPTWQPDAGEIGGAIQCDGVDDVIITKPVPSLNEGPFSIVLWIKGGGPGQGIVAQQGAANWLYLNPADGSLMTGLTGSGQNARPLYSDVVLTDDQWHRIALVWDGARRILCVDGEEATSDEQDGLLVSGTGLTIGCDCNMAPGTFFSGLIDDVRIYTRAVKP
jgi:hypothetical protein